MSSELLRARGGVVYAEFLMSFMCFLILFVCSVQLAVLATASLVIQHAAVQAVRAAVVTIDDDPAFYDDGHRKHLESKGGGKGSDGTEKAMAMIAKLTGHSPAGLGARGTERVNRIRNAAYLPLSVISPTAEQVARWVPFATSVNPALAESSLYDDIGDNPVLRMVVGLGVYSRIGAAVTFPESPRSEKLRSSSDAEFQDHETVTVRVTYLLPCNVPLARDIVCDNAVGLTGLPDAVRSSVQAVTNPGLESFERAYRTWTNTHQKGGELKQSMRELVRAEWSSLQLAILTRMGERFAILTAEASLPNHGASYKYYSELNQAGSP